MSYNTKNGQAETQKYKPLGEFRSGSGSSQRSDYVYFPWNTPNGQERLQWIKSGKNAPYDSLQKLEYTYDALGNVKTIKAGFTLTYGDSTHPHAEAAFNGWVHAYDSNGNITTRIKGGLSLQQQARMDHTSSKTIFATLQGRNSSYRLLSQDFY